MAWSSWDDSSTGDAVWDGMLDYWQTTGQLDQADISAASEGGLSLGDFRSLGYRASFGDRGWNDPTGDAAPFVSEWRTWWADRQTAANAAPAPSGG